ncbi:MAG: hypothetical protein Q9209_001898 [Squamulea sp. 1 TL-2023]
MPSEDTNKSTASNSSCSSCVSESSTVVYSHESYEIFEPRVQQLCRHLWPLAAEAESFEVERLKGGSYNRVIGIKTPPSTGEAQRMYILRIPRFEIAQQQREIAILRYVRQHTSIPTAEVIFSDSTTQNPLNEPYMIQTRIAGQSLQHVYPTMNHEQKRAIAKQWGQLVLSQRTVQNNSSGVVDATTDEDGTIIFAIHPYDVYLEQKPDPVDVRLSPTQSILEMFVTQFERWDAAAVQSSRAPASEFRPDHWDRLAAIAKDMDATGMFKDSCFTLCHLDLHPRNVMVDIQPDGAAKITGVLDWDSAVFAPDFVVCTPPSWIWAWKDDEDEPLDEADTMPDSPEDQTLKRDFEDAVGNELLEAFYAPQYRMARQLFDIALDGIRTNVAFEEAHELMKDWAEFQSGPTSSSPKTQVDLSALHLSSIHDGDAESAQ